MVRTTYTGIFFVLVTLIFLTSCSNGKSPVTPERPDLPGITDLPVVPSTDDQSDRSILAVYDVVIDTDSGAFSVEPAERTADFHFPLTQFYPNVLQITGYGFTPNFWADIKLTHPLPGSGINAFDPRIIAIVPYNTSNYFYFPNFNIVGNSKIVMEPDGYTKLHDSLGGTIAGNINPFKAYFKNQPYRVWSSTGATSETQRWNLNLAGFSGTIKYKFVVDVSTSYPAPSLPVLSNAPEPVSISAVIGKGLNPEGGDTFIDVELLDWQGQSGIGDVIIEAPSLFTGTKTLSFEEGTDNNFYYHGSFANSKTVAAGDYDLMVKTSDTSSGVEMYNLYKAKVTGHTPSDPSSQTTSAIELTPNRIFMDGEFLYMGAGDHGLHIYNISDPRNPVWVNWVNTNWTNDVFVADGLAYVASDDAFRILDVSDPSEIGEIVRIETEGQVWGLTVKSGYAFLADAYNGLVIVDVDPVEDAHIVKQIATTHDASKVAVSNGYAYVAVGLGLDVIDVNPINSASVVCTVPIYAIDVQILEDHAYIASGSSELNIVNISHPEEAFLEGSIETPDSALSVELYRDYVLVADDDGGLQIIQLEGPASGEIVSSVECYAMDVCANEEFAYVADYYTGIRVVGIDPPEEARLRGIVYGLRQPFDVEVVGNYLYAAVGTDGLQIIDNTPLDKWHVVKTVPTAMDSKRLDVENGYACVVDYTVGLKIIDVDPYETASVVNTIPESPEFIPNDVVISNGYAYVANYGLSIVDIDPPSTASIVKSVYTATESYGVCIDNGYAYVTDYGGLQIIDIEPIESAHVVKFVDTPGLPYDVRAENGYAYVANKEAVTGMQIIDVYPPELAHLANTVTTAQWQYTIDIYGGYAYVSESAAGFEIIDTEPAETAYVLKTIDTSHNCVNVNVFNGFAYVSDWNTVWYYDRLIAFQLW